MHHHSASDTPHTHISPASVATAASSLLSSEPSVTVSPSTAQNMVGSSSIRVKRSSGIFSAQVGVTAPSGARRPAAAMRNTKSASASAPDTTAAAKKLVARGVQRVEHAQRDVQLARLRHGGKHIARYGVWHKLRVVPDRRVGCIGSAPSAAVSVTSDVVISCAAVSSYGTSFTRSDHT